MAALTLTAESVVALATEARQAAWAGDVEAAFATLALAEQAIVTEYDREAVFEATAALVAEDRPVAVVAALQAGAAGSGAERPWARRALAVAYASAGDAAGADALAHALTSEDAGTAHALFGHALRVRLAVEADSAAMALARLSDLGAVVTPLDTASVETYGAALALVAAAFPEAGLPGAAARTASSDKQAAGASAAALAGTVADGVSVWPNPSAGRVHVAVSVSAQATAAEASVYDVLGRRVALLHEGPLPAGTHELAFEAGSLAPGLYVVRVRVTPAEGVPWSETRRVTVAR